MPIRLKANDPRLPPELRQVRPKRHKAPPMLRGEVVREMLLVLPLPPSVNNYWWTHKSGKRIVGKEGRAFKKAVAAFAVKANLGHLVGRIKVDMMLCGSKMDIDNAVKPTLDACQSAGLFANDSQIDELHVCRGRNVTTKPMMTVRLETI